MRSLVCIFMFAACISQQLDELEKWENPIQIFSDAHTGLEFRCSAQKGVFAGTGLLVAAVHKATRGAQDRETGHLSHAHG